MNRTRCVVRFTLVAAVVATAAVPSTMFAQITFGNAPKVEKKAPAITADSFATAKAFAQSKQPVIIINHEVVTYKELAKIALDSLATIEFRQGDAEVKHYGKKAENGVLVFRTKNAGRNSRR